MKIGDSANKLESADDGKGFIDKGREFADGCDHPRLLDADGEGGDPSELLLDELVEPAQHQESGRDEGGREEGAGAEGAEGGAGGVG